MKSAGKRSSHLFILMSLMLVFGVILMLSKKSDAQTVSQGWAMSVHASDVSTLNGGAESMAADPATGDIFVKSIRTPDGWNVQVARVSPDGTVKILVTFPLLRNSHFSGITLDPLTGGIIVADEISPGVPGRIALINTSNQTVGTLFTLPWVLNPHQNGTGQHQYALDPNNPYILYFWDSTQSKIFRLDRRSNILSEVLALDQATPVGEHFATFSNDIAFDPATGTVLVSDGLSNSILEVDPAASAATATTLFSGLPGKPTAIALNQAGDQIFVVVQKAILVGPRTGGSLSLVADGLPNVPTDIVPGKASVGNGQSIFVADRIADTVYELSKLPVANAGPDQRVQCAGANGRTVTLDGTSSSDPNGNTLTFTWKEGSTILGIGPIIRPVLSSGYHDITLVVDDGFGHAAEDNVAISITDTAAPNTVKTIGGIAGNNEWYRSDVSVILDAADTCSGTKEIRYTLDNLKTVVPGSKAAFTITTEGVHSCSYLAVDNAGNAETEHPLTIKIDKSPPAITASLTQQPSSGGWYNSDVTVTFTCDDTVSGIAHCPDPVIVNSEGIGQVATGTAQDNAGNQASATIMVNIDKTAPSIKLSLSPALLWPPNHKYVKVTPTITVSDNLDAKPVIELVSVTSNQPVDGVGDGNTAKDIVVNRDGTIMLRAERSGSDTDRVYTVTYRAHDQAGNISIASASVVVSHSRHTDWRHVRDVLSRKK